MKRVSAADISDALAAHAVKNESIGLMGGRSRMQGYGRLIGRMR